MPETDDSVKRWTLSDRLERVNAVRIRVVRKAHASIDRIGSQDVA